MDDDFDYTNPSWWDDNLGNDISITTSETN